MIKKVEKENISECVRVICDSFITVANEFGFTVENAPRFTAFATTEDRLNWHLLVVHTVYALRKLRCRIKIYLENLYLKGYESTL